jgi:hypothetical protein
MVSLCNSDPAVVRLANRWICSLTTNLVDYGIQYHADQDIEELRTFWAGELAIDPSRVRFQRKSNTTGSPGGHGDRSTGCLR